MAKRLNENLNDAFKRILASFKGVRVGITGHTGFKGAWLTHLLRGSGAKLGGFSLAPFPRENNLFETSGCEDAFELSTIASLKHVGELKRWMFNFQPQIIFHLAAQPLVSVSYKTPVETFETNVSGLVNLLECVRHAESVTAVIVVSSDKCYLNDGSGRPFREPSQLGGGDPYSASKACAEIIASAFKQSFFDISGKCLLATVRAGNVIGGGDWSMDRLIPDIVRSAENEAKLYVRNPSFTRPWQHVLDPLRGYVTLGAELLTGNASMAQPFNFGPAECSSLSVMDIVDQASNYWSDRNIPIVLGKGVFKESEKLSIDVSKAETELNFRNKWDTFLSVEKTLDWYQQVVFEGRSAKEVTEKQITHYLDQ